MSKSLLIVDANIKFQNVISQAVFRGRHDNGYNSNGYVSFEYYYSLDTSLAQHIAELNLLYSSNTEDETVVKLLAQHNAKPFDGVSDGQANFTKVEIASIGQKQKMHSVIDAGEYDKVFRVISPLPMFFDKYIYINPDTGELLDKKIYRKSFYRKDGTIELRSMDDKLVVSNVKQEHFVRIWDHSFELDKKTLAPVTDMNGITGVTSEEVTQEDADNCEKPSFKSLLNFVAFRKSFHNKRYETRNAYYVLDWSPSKDNMTHEGINPTKQICGSYQEAVDIVKEWKKDLVKNNEILFNHQYVSLVENEVKPGKRFEISIELSLKAPVKYANVKILGSNLIVFKGQPFVLYAAVTEIEKTPNAFLRTESRIMKGNSVMRMFSESFWRV